MAIATTPPARGRVPAPARLNADGGLPAPKRGPRLLPQLKPDSSEGQLPPQAHQSLPHQNLHPPIRAGNSYENSVRAMEGSTVPRMASATNNQLRTRSRQGTFWVATLRSAAATAACVHGAAGQCSVSHSTACHPACPPACLPACLPTCTHAVHGRMHPLHGSPQAPLTKMAATSGVTTTAATPTRTPVWTPVIRSSRSGRCRPGASRGGNGGGRGSVRATPAGRLHKDGPADASDCKGGAAQRLAPQSPKHLRNRTKWACQPRHKARRSRQKAVPPRLTASGRGPARPASA